MGASESTTTEELTSFQSLFAEPRPSPVSNSSGQRKTFRVQLADRLISSSDVYTDDQIAAFLTGIDPYRDDVILALELFALGHSRMAMFVIGRTLEDALMLYFLRKRFRGTPVEKKKKMDFDSVIKFLGYNKHILTPSTTEKMLSLKWDRNVGGHPAGEVEIEQLNATSRQMFEMGVFLIKGVLKLINKTASKI